MFHVKQRAPDWQQAGFGLYVHWPFCQAKCPYCDFNSHVSARIDQRAWARAYLSEIDRLAAETGPLVLHSIFFGGGTPSLMDPETVAAVIARARHHWPAGNDLEVTLEANPTSVEADRFHAYAQAGVTRVSLGVQALDDAALTKLGRLHSAVEARAAFDVARATFNRVSFDLIYARQDQTLADWAAELHEALAMTVDHLSLYQLTIEPGTAFGARHAKGGLCGLPPDDTAADMYMLTQDICATYGLPGYEISNHARPGSESRHNLIYWRGGDYAGIGPGAHGRLTLNGTRYATRTPLAPAAWLDQVTRAGHGEAPRDMVPPEEQAIEYAMMALRLHEGMDLSRFTGLNGAPLPDARMAQLVEDGFVTRTESRLAVTPQGQPVLNAVLRALLS